MAGYLITPLKVEDIEEFVQCQFEAFAGNPLHDVVYPDRSASIISLRKGVEEAKRLETGNEIEYLCAIDGNSQKIIGAIKGCFYGADIVHTTSPYAAVMPNMEEPGTDHERYTRYVYHSFLGKRVTDIKGPHARKILSLCSEVHY